MEGVQAFDHAAAASLIRWWRDAGVDVLVDDAPRDWLKAAVPSPQKQSVAEPRSLAAKPVPEQVDAAFPSTLPEFLSWLGSSSAVPEASWGASRILPSGDPQSGLMILTDMPDRDDAAAGRLIAGEVGDLFDKMLAAIGRSRETVWLAPFATVRKLGRLSDADRDRLVRIARNHIALIAPRRLLIMGQTPAEALLGPDWTDARADYRLLNFNAVMVETLATYTPRGLHEKPSLKKDAWRTLQLLMKGL